MFGRVGEEYAADSVHDAVGADVVDGEDVGVVDLGGVTIGCDVNARARRSDDLFAVE
jgi:hypothetical protein